MTREPITFRVPPEMKRQFFSKLALRGRKAQFFLEQAVHDFLSQEDAMTQITITIYPGNMSQESVSHVYLNDAATNFANELTPKIRAAYPDAEFEIDIRPATESSPDGGVSCEDPDMQEHVQYIYDQTFNQGNFWPEITGHCIYCDRAVYTETAPAYDDDEAWADLALEHAEDCPWILTRAHQIEEDF